MVNTSNQNAGLERNGVENLQRLAKRQLLPFGLSIAALIFLWDKAAGLDFAHIWAGIGRVTYLEWCMAAGLSAVSFWAVGRYDAVVHRLTRTGINANEATRAGVTAIAIAQSVGVGVISGALVRWRMLPNLSLLESIRISVIVSLSFLAGWAVIAAIAVLVSPTTLPFPATPFFAWGIISLAVALVLLSLFRPGPIARLRIPSLRAMGAIFLLALVDTLTAGGALYALLPSSIEIDLPTFLAAFLVALGAGLIMGSPGGIGPFEVMLVTLLPHVDVASLLSAVLAFRIVYYLIPALIAAISLIRGPKMSKSNNPKTSEVIHNPRRDVPPLALHKLIQNAPEAEANLLRSGRLSLLSDKQRAAMVCFSSQSLIMLRGPLRKRYQPAEIIRELQRRAQVEFITPCLYKTPARLAVAARQAGWKVLPIAKEAIINPQSYNTNGRERRQLRRKLRKTANSDIVISDNQNGIPLPLPEMDRVSKDWTSKRGSERGFSMGAYDPSTLEYSRAYFAWKNGKLLGFLTLHQNPQEQVLDLMRYNADAPDGLMHLLLDHAIQTAKSQGVERVSLAAVPIENHARDTPFISKLRQHLDQVSGAYGLRQFKTCFAPKWTTLYFAAPTISAFAVSAIDISREITRNSP